MGFGLRSLALKLALALTPNQRRARLQCRRACAVPGWVRARARVRVRARARVRARVSPA